ncbi:hypothetical protein [Bradyrhizobium uaiense]|uniref:Uncharacterized protein n=1 Tax=Bradyrhizobium uaiense TaxID=2594946 RepID=A0A6P1BL09_9BRAD|nr:hypothetical protein [Bradyrhizobium uaiense]NEU98884.1 hypothetical protein [Bradyrhizobium uaiense]
MTQKGRFARLGSIAILLLTLSNSAAFSDYSVVAHFFCKDAGDMSDRGYCEIWQTSRQSCDDARSVVSSQVSALADVCKQCPKRIYDNTLVYSGSMQWLSTNTCR